MKIFVPMVWFIKTYFQVYVNFHFPYKYVVVIGKIVNIEWQKSLLHKLINKANINENDVRETGSMFRVLYYWSKAVYL